MLSRDEDYETISTASRESMAHPLGTCQGETRPRPAQSRAHTSIDQGDSKIQDAEVGEEITDAVKVFTQGLGDVVDAGQAGL